MFHALVEFLRTLTTPEKLIELLTTVFTGWLGYALLVGIIYAETGLLTGFFLPGDSFLFTVGVVAGAAQLNIYIVIPLLMAAGIAGDSTGYYLGRRTGQHIFNRPDSRFFRREHLLRSKAFYEKHGGKTIVYAKFIPIIRTFAPFLAGVSGMNYLRFLAFSVTGVTLWVCGITTAGVLLGSVPFARQNFDKVVLGIIALSLVPIGVEALKARRRRAAATPAAESGD
ncbi:MAG TPA: VTT domain-containing protein [Bryobacteraceae bacterium]|nr:VTT domain-containing protein [Bryobacteraceae bacterium]HOQ45549.1 VTT domain-containing protein [Bryobacteraceae bacterium]HPQ17486.1 VTT domain-containing protein [Bryobacteraceae bacterium]HPU73413.1 VTT domain-containing protein [Bryobacteraceae bacterium]